MAQQRSNQAVPIRVAWQEVVDGQMLHTCTAEDIVAAARALGGPHDDHLRGKLIENLLERARRILTPLVDRNLPDEGQGAIRAVLDGMVDALLDPKAADGAGYEAAFRPKLRQRLVDQLRKLRKQVRRHEEPSCEEEGEVPEPGAPSEELTPEEASIAASVIKALPERHRKALSLYRMGYRCSSPDGTETIASMMGISTRTAEKLMREVRVMIKQHLD